MSDINSVVIHGRIVKDAEVRQVGNNTVLTFTIAVNKGYKKGDEWVNDVSFFDCKIWNKNPDKYVKGAACTVSGALDQERWKDSTGKSASRVVIKADLVQFESTGKALDNNGYAPSEPVAEEPVQQAFPF